MGMTLDLRPVQPDALDPAPARVATAPWKPMDAQKPEV